MRVPMMMSPFILPEWRRFSVSVAFRVPSIFPHTSMSFEVRVPEKKPSSPIITCPLDFKVPSTLPSIRMSLLVIMSPFIVVPLAMILWEFWSVEAYFAILCKWF